MLQIYWKGKLETLSVHSYSLRNERNRTTNFSLNYGNQNPMLILLKKKITRNIRIEKKYK